MRLICFAEDAQMRQQALQVGLRPEHATFSMEPCNVQWSITHSQHP
jgi:hypothetical protein